MDDRVVLRLHSKVYNMKVLDSDLMSFISFYNKVIFYKDRLMKLMNSLIAKRLFSEAEMRNLVRHMVYLPCNANVNKKAIGTISYPTCLTRMILAGMIKVDYDEIQRELNKTIKIKNNDIHICKSEIGYCFNCYMMDSLCELYYKKGGTIKRVKRR